MSAPKPPVEPPGVVPVGLQRLLRAVRRDEAALAALLADRSAYAESRGIALTPTERSILDKVDAPQLRRIIESLPEQDFAWAEPPDVPCGGIQPDMPPPRQSAPVAAQPSLPDRVEPAPRTARDDRPPPSEPRESDPSGRPGSLFEKLRRFVLGK